MDRFQEKAAVNLNAFPFIQQLIRKAISWWLRFIPLRLKS
jgi:hypothetical protein